MGRSLKKGPFVNAKLLKAIDMKKGEIEIFNKNYFEPLKDYQIVWSLYQDGTCLEAPKALPGEVSTLAARKSLKVTLPYDYTQLDPTSFSLSRFLPAAEKRTAPVFRSTTAVTVPVETVALDFPETVIFGVTDGSAMTDTLFFSGIAAPGYLTTRMMFGE